MLKNDVHIVFQHAKQKCDFCFAAFFNRVARLKNVGASMRRPQAAEKRGFPAAC
jgi:hypothetical protein